jgi:myo-inositol 2-dehydrogenase / D-chiro-inositol 1-dehydrogenase
MNQHPVTRREFLKTSAALAAAPLAIERAAHAAGSDEIRVGLIGCGSRGTGAAFNILDASPRTRIGALGDVFPDRLEGCRQRLAERGENGAVAGRSCFNGFDAYRGVLSCEVDAVILATPPHFRPMHFAAAVEAGRHVFMEKPVAVDPAGVRRVLIAADEADRRGLSVVAGTQRRHEDCYREAIARIQGGAVGRIGCARCSWNMGGLWMLPRRDDWSDMEWQLRNWLYFTWLSGDHIVEQHVHNLDVANWVLGAHPLRALGLGGRQVRIGPEYGQIFDHFAIEYEYPGGVYVTSFCRQIDGCANRVEESFSGTEGEALLRSGFAEIRGAAPWRFEADQPDPYVTEQRNLLASISGGPRLNEARQVAQSTLTAIMGRMSAYTGQEVTWEQAINSKLDLSPPAYELGPLAVPPVTVPGRTPLI